MAHPLPPRITTGKNAVPELPAEFTSRPLLRSRDRLSRAHHTYPRYGNRLYLVIVSGRPSRNSRCVG